MNLHMKYCLRDWVYHENPATAIALAIYKLKTGKDWS